jgi:hypothetical protein
VGADQLLVDANGACGSHASASTIHTQLLISPTEEDSNNMDVDPRANVGGRFAPVIHPTLGTGVEAMVVAARAWLSQ